MFKKIQLYNSLTNQKETLDKPIGSQLRIYTCGPTVWNYAHIGNFRTFVFEDILRRWLSFSGYEIRQVKNLTDVDDKIIKASRELGISPKELTSKYTDAFLEDIKTLNIRRAEIYPKATEHIDEMHQLTVKLIEKDFAYQKTSGIYFRTKLTEKFSKFVKTENLEVGASGVELEKDKEDPADFALWKAATPEDGEVYWELFGKRFRPGWHLECSAMALKHLSDLFENGDFESLDIHTGGVDLQFPHHQCEIAQSEAITGKPFSRFWMHAEHLLVDGQKMSKSLGNFYTLRDLLDKNYHPLAIRYLLFSAHYRQPMNFTFDSLKAATQAVQKINDFVTDLCFILEESGFPNPNSSSVEPEILKLTDKLMADFTENLNDDLHMPKALSNIFDYINKLYSQYKLKISGYAANHILSTFSRLNEILDILLPGQVPGPEAMELLDARRLARIEKNWKESDLIREILRTKHISVEDRPSGQKWKYLLTNGS